MSNSPPGPGAGRSARLITRLVGKSLPRTGVKGSEPPWSPGNMCRSPASGHQWPLISPSWGKALAYGPAVNGSSPLCCVFFFLGARITSPSLLGWKQRERTPGEINWSWRNAVSDSQSWPGFLLFHQKDVLRRAGPPGKPAGHQHPAVPHWP